MHAPQHAAAGSDARVCNTTISHPHGLGQELFLGPIRIDLFSPDKQLLHQLVPFGVFLFRFLVRPELTNYMRYMGRSIC